MESFFDKVFAFLGIVAYTSIDAMADDGRGETMDNDTKQLFVLTILAFLIGLC